MIASAISSLAPLAFLACPIGMGLMMWMMARGTKSQKPAGAPETDSTPSIEVLREDHRRLGEQIERLGHRDGDAARPLAERR